MSASVARKLAEAGLDAAAIVVALEAFEAAEEERKAKTRERKRRQRAREVTECHVTERDVTGQDVTVRDTPRPLPPSPQTPQPPTPTPGEQSRARKGRSAEKPDTDLTERIWQAASRVSRGRSGRPALGKAVLAAIRAGASDAAILASVRSHCADQGDFAKGVHLVVAGEHWRDHEPRHAKPNPPPDPTVLAHRLRHHADTGEWRPEWGRRPAPTPPQGQAA